MTTQGRRLHRLDALTNTHVGRQINVNGLVGRLDALLPVGDHIALTLNVGGATVFTDAYPATTTVDVWRVAS